jgi:hypothetical protein
MAGGTPARIASVRKRKLDAEDYREIGQWIDEQLKKFNVWVVLMPSNQFDGVLVKGLEYNPNWQLVFLNNKQKLFVDVTTPRGKELFEGIFSGKTHYPDEFSRNLVIAHTMFLYSKDADSRKKALSYAVNAFRARPSAVPMQEILTASKFPELRPLIASFCKSYFDEYTENKGLWIKQHAFHSKTVAAFLAVQYLRNLAVKANDNELAEFYQTERAAYDRALKHMLATKRW